METQNDYQHKVLDGRKFHDNAKITYLLPEDDDESSRLHKQHVVLKFAIQSNFQAPLEKQLEEGITVLDSGCGPASWMFEMAEQFPNSTFHGIDITLAFPEEKKPDNCEFVIGNIAGEIPYPDNTFDYIHQRLLLLGLTSDQWEKTLKELHRVLKPGGFIEISEPDLQDLRNMGPLLGQLQSTMSKMLEFRGMPPKISCQLKERVTQTGFVDAKEKIIYLSLNHSGRAGKLLWDDYVHGYRNMRPIMATSNPVWEDAEEYEVHMVACAAETEENKTDVPWHTVIAQKALE